MPLIIFLFLTCSFSEVFEEETRIDVEGEHPVKKDQEIIALEKELENITVRDQQNRQKTSLFEKLSQRMDNLAESQRSYQDYKDEYGRKIDDFNKAVEQDQKEESEKNSEKIADEMRTNYTESIQKVLETKKSVLRRYCRTEKREQILTGLRISGKGKVESVRFYTDDLRDIHRCMARHISRFSFPQTPDNKAWQVDVPVNFI